MDPMVTFWFGWAIGVAGVCIGYLVTDTWLMR